MAQHVKLAADEEHGPHGTMPERDVDNPWNLRLEDARRGRCPACEFGVLGLKGGDGFLSRGRRRLACTNCGWESPEWIEIE
jgi:hypothetical protein